MGTTQPPDRWIRLAAGYQSDPRILAAGYDGELVYIRGLALARMLHTDGHLSYESWTQLVRGLDRRRTRFVADRLITVGLWEPCDDGWQVPLDRWSKWQVTEGELAERRTAATARQARWRTKKDGDP
jgi:hypothetical protein